MQARDTRQEYREESEREKQWKKSRNASTAAAGAVDASSERRGSASACLFRCVSLLPGMKELEERERKTRTLVNREKRRKDGEQLGDSITRTKGREREQGRKEERERAL